MLPVGLIIVGDATVLHDMHVDSNAAPVEVEYLPAVQDVHKLLPEEI